MNTDSSQRSSFIRKVVPDVRSDIYSTGATLYHLLCGKRPAKDAVEVEPLSDKEFSKPIADMINKAMNPNPDLRYQTAAEMLYELEHLHENDPRVKRQRRGLIVFESVMCAALVLGVFTSFTGLKRIQATDNALKLAEYSDNALARGDRVSAVDNALRALPLKSTIFTPAPTAQAQCSLAAALGVYDLSDSFKAERIVELPSEPLDMALSPNGKTFACVCSGEVVICSAETGGIIERLSADSSALSSVRYIGDDVIVYSGQDAVTAYSLAQKQRCGTESPRPRCAFQATARPSPPFTRTTGMPLSVMP